MFVEAGMVFGHGVSSLFCGAVAVASASGCCSTRGLLLMGWRGLFFLGLSCWIGDILEFTLSQVVYSYRYGLSYCSCWFCHWHLGQCCCSGNLCWSKISGQGGVGGQRRVGRHGLCDYSHLKPFHWCFGSLLFSFLGY